VLGSVHIALFAGIHALPGRGVPVRKPEPSPGRNADPAHPNTVGVLRSSGPSSYPYSPNLVKGEPSDFGCRDSKKFGMIDPKLRPTRRSYPCPGRTSGGPTIEAMTAPDIIIAAVA